MLNLSAEVPNRGKIARYISEVTQKLLESVEPERALSLSRGALAVAPELQSLHINHCEALRAAGKFVEADSAANALIDAFPDSSAGYVQLMLLCEQKQQHGEAKRLAQRILAMEPSNDAALACLAKRA